MKPNPAHAVGRIRLCGYLEGASFLILLFVAMPLKYAFAMPLAVRYVGMAHGLLFVLLCLLLLIGWPGAEDLRKARRAGLRGLAGSLRPVPGGPEAEGG